jgi:hypothetical protein
MTNNVERQVKTKSDVDSELEELSDTLDGLESQRHFSPSEQELLRELLSALRVMRYGSVVATVHDGRVIEIQKTERIRRPSTK